MKLKKGKNEVAEAPTHSLPLEMIVDHPDIRSSYRKLDKDWANELESSITRDGLDTPLTVWNGGTACPMMEVNGTEVPSSFLVTGNHRRFALRNLRKSNPDRFNELFPGGIPVVMRDYNTLKEVLCAMLRENVARKDPTAEELLPVMIRLRDEFTMKNKEIAGSIGRSPSFVTMVFDIESELGDEGKEAVAKGEVSARDAIKAAQDVKKAKKKGLKPDAKAALQKAKDATKKRKDAGRERTEKRPSAKRLYKAYRALPALSMGRKILILEALFDYITGEQDTLPKEIRSGLSAKEDKSEE